MNTVDRTTLQQFAEVRKEIYDFTNELMSDVVLRGGAHFGQCPRPIEAIVAMMGSHVFRAPGRLLHGNHGLCTASTIVIPDTDGRHWVQRFTVAHELGHQQLGSSAMEWECDAFAGSILIPSDDLRDQMNQRQVHHACRLTRWADYENENGLITCYVRRYGVGYNAMIRALADYGWVVGIAPWTSVVHGDRLYEEYEYYYRRGRGG